MTEQSSPHINKAYRFSIAPMLDCTDTHFRVLMRHITRKALLYTEMIVARALYENKRPEKILKFDKSEHPIALQIGGDDPKILSKAAQIGHDWGYDEINLNIGCPSARVKSGNFGACLMADPDKVARCIEAIKEATPLDVTIKHRTGIDHLDNQEFLTNFVDRIASAGAKRFAIHARKAWLDGLNPKQNRTIPPLQYERVALLKASRPSLTIELNGGLNTLEDCQRALKIFDGAMVGRAAYENPLKWQLIDEKIYGEKASLITASKIIREMIPYAEKHLNTNGRLWDICRHMLHLVKGVPGSKNWRKDLGTQGQKRNADSRVLEKAARQLEEAGL